MNLQTVLLLNLGIFVTAQILIKLIVSRLPKTLGLSIQFFGCAALISLFALATGHRQLVSSANLIVLPVGFLVAFGAYCQWRAIDLSLSRTTLFSPLTNALVVILAILFLGETDKWTLRITIGIALCFLAVFLFRTASRRQKATENQDNSRKWLFFMGGMILIFGTATFLMKVFAADIPRVEFLTAWYVGAFLGSLPIFFLKKESSRKLPGKAVLLVPLASLAIMGNLATQYWAFQLAPASRVVPFQSVGTTFLPVLVGWFIFKERKELSKKELAAFVVGAAGALFIILP